MVEEKERDQIIQEFLARKREAEANKARAAQEKAAIPAPWAVDDWNYKISPARNGYYIVPFPHVTALLCISLETFDYIIL